MKFFVKIAANLYRNYEAKGLDMVYLRTIFTIGFSVFLHVVQLFLLFNIPQNI
jgi:hypothetical protein